MSAYQKPRGSFGHKRSGSYEFARKKGYQWRKPYESSKRSEREHDEPESGEDSGEVEFFEEEVTGSPSGSEEEESGSDVEEVELIPLTPAAVIPYSCSECKEVKFVAIANTTPELWCFNCEASLRLPFQDFDALAKSKK